MPDTKPLRNRDGVCPVLRALAGRFLAGSALGLVIAGPAAAQVVAAAANAPEQVIITGQVQRGYNVEAPAYQKLTEPLIETPQSIDAVSQQELRDRSAATLEEALRNVPSISLGAGEFMFQGNNPSIRGFVARTDIYLDGMRDSGNYYRDPFNLESVEVLEGPSSILFGRGSTGGVINQVSKMPTLDSITEGTIVGGTDATRRGVIDINRVLPDLGLGAAFRITAMAHEADVAGRDGAHLQRYGFAPSVALGLGTPTRLTLSYFHQSTNDVPDYGIPWYFGRPAPVSRDNFYGFTSDYLNTVADVGTLKVEHDLAPGITLSDRVRVADYTRESRITQAVLPAGVTLSTPLSSINVNRNVYGGHSQEQFVQNQTDVTARFDTGVIRHDLVAGFEVANERSAPEFDNGLNVPPTSLVDPPEQSIFPVPMYERFHADTKAKSYGAYFMDTLKFGEQWDLLLGARWDRFDLQYRSQTFSVPPAVLNQLVSVNNQNRSDSMPSYRAALVYKPETNGSIYASFGTSFNPSAENVSLLTSGENFGVSNEFLAPEKNRSFEVGTKWDFFNKRASASLAAFNIEKTNARVPDPLNPGFNTLEGTQRVNGFEVLAQGYITEAWQISGGYDYLDGQLTKTLTAGAKPGSLLLNVPKHSLTFWTTYEFPFGFVIGGGGKYVSSRYAQTTTPILKADGYWEFDAMAKYLVTERISVQLNIYNVADNTYFEQTHPHFVIPAPGRSALLSVNFRY